MCKNERTEAEACEPTNHKATVQRAASYICNYAGIGAGNRHGDWFHFKTGLGNSC